jgi:hypothetical protein
MGETLNEVVAALPPPRRERVEARYQELRREAERLGQCHPVAAESPADITVEPKSK